MLFRNLIFVSLAPVLIIAFYIYHSDRYEKEPLSVLLKALFTGALTIIPAVIIEGLIAEPSGAGEGLASAGYTAFVVAGFTEELMKYLAFYFFFWQERNFNEKFDGIIYAVYISLGFAAVENILYVFSGGMGVGFVRAFTAVPAHALFGISMGYYFGLARFDSRYRILKLMLAFIVPFFFHGLYDFLLMSKSQVLLTVFVPVFIYYWATGFRKISKLSDASPFRDSPGRRS
ncbi:MAG TPA: PrsW family glutamic-type intramembrane protease [Bacteroidales bacterium]|nr:PrsW family intramembrane metalloprotease [Bacteroidales bacterium]HNR43361.1 PrsW family glutamic-type intramembrane protease [Bacteroidales bacterium]HPM18448.1 PrsW family glutamic-type intramembrane protease [Bacteroidales bacterium]HQG78261.1 PrsW family glutamic-type intramembrane protease [Bacteroidales bacterium]